MLFKLTEKIQKNITEKFAIFCGSVADLDKALSAAKVANTDDILRKEQIAVEIVKVANALMDIPYDYGREFITFNASERKDAKINNIEQQFKQVAFIYLPRFAITITNRGSDYLEDLPIIELAQSVLDISYMVAPFFQIGLYIETKCLKNTTLSVAAEMREFTKDFRKNIAGRIISNLSTKDAFDQFSNSLDQLGIQKRQGKWTAFNALDIPINYGTTDIVEYKLIEWQQNTILANKDSIENFYRLALNDAFDKKNLVAFYTIIDQLYNYLDSLPKEFKESIISGLTLNTGGDLIWCEAKEHRDKVCLSNIRVKIMHASDGSDSLVKGLVVTNEVFNLGPEKMIDILRYSLNLIYNDYETDEPLMIADQEKLEEIKNGLEYLSNHLSFDILSTKIKSLEDLVERFNTAVHIIPHGLRSIDVIKSSFNDYNFLSSDLVQNGSIQQLVLDIENNHYTDQTTAWFELDGILMGLGEACRNLDVFSELKDKRDGFCIEPIDNIESLATLEELVTLLKAYRGDKTHCCHTNYNIVEKLLHFSTNEKIEVIEKSLEELSDAVLPAVRARIANIVDVKVKPTGTLNQKEKTGYHKLYQAVDEAVESATESFYQSEINTGSRLKNKFQDLVKSTSRQSTCNIS